MPCLALLCKLAAFLRDEWRIAVLFLLLHLLLHLPLPLSLDERVLTRLEIALSRIAISSILRYLVVIACRFIAARRGHGCFTIAVGLEGLWLELVLFIKFLAQFFTLFLVLFLSALELFHGDEVACRGRD